VTGPSFAWVTAEGSPRSRPRSRWTYAGFLVGGDEEPDRAWRAAEDQRLVGRVPAASGPGMPSVVVPNSRAEVRAATAGCFGDGGSAIQTINTGPASWAAVSGEAPGSRTASGLMACGDRDGTAWVAYRARGAGRRRGAGCPDAGSQQR